MWGKSKNEVLLLTNQQDALIILDVEKSIRREQALSF